MIVINDKNISIQDFSYILGLFFADANISFCKGKPESLQYEISIKDEDIIYKLSKIIPDSKIITRIRDTNFKKNYKSICLRTRNKFFLNKLLEYKYPINNKCYNINIPPKEYSEDNFWRGIIDGDGSLGIRKAGIYLSLVTKSEKLKNSFINYVFKITGNKITSQKNKRDDIFNITIVGKNAYLVAKQLYDNNILHIDRKYNKFKEIEEFYNLKHKKTFITGDCHGIFDRFINFCKNIKPDNKDVMICLGDIGLNYYLNKRDIKNKKLLNGTNLTYFIIHGNHEKNPENISSYKKIKLPNIDYPNITGTVLIEPNFPNLLFAIDGNTYFINGNKFFVIGGAYSVDGQYRRLKGWQWFEDEQISIQRINKIKNNFKQLKNIKHTDYILSHTCPKKYEPTHLFLPYIDQSAVDKRTEEFLDWVEENVKYKKWYFGHFHANEQVWDNGYMLFNSVKEIETK